MDTCTPMWIKLLDILIVFVAEVGDYDPDEHGEGAGYLSEFKFCPKQVKIIPRLTCNKLSTFVIISLSTTIFSFLVINYWQIDQHEISPYNNQYIAKWTGNEN